MVKENTGLTITRNDTLKTKISLELGRLSAFFQSTPLELEDADKELERFIDCMISAYGQSALNAIISVCNDIHESGSDDRIAIEIPKPKKKRYVWEQDESEYDQYIKPNIRSYFSEYVTDACVKRKENIKEVSKKIRKHKKEDKKEKYESGETKAINVIEVEKITARNFSVALDIMAKMQKPTIDITLQAMLLDMRAKDRDGLMQYCRTMNYNGAYELKYSYIENRILEFIQSGLLD